MYCLRVLVKYLVCLLAFITWLVGSGIIVITIWILSTSPNLKKVFTGTLPVTYIAFGFGILFFISGLLGWMGSYKKGGCLIRMFLFLCVLTIAAEIGGIISLSILRAKVSDIVDQGWGELNDRSRNLIQQQLECCALHGPSEYAYKSEPIDSSCYNNVLNTPKRQDENTLEINTNTTTESNLNSLHQTGCKDAMVNWIYKHKMIWVASFGGILLYQVISLLLAVSLVNNIKRRHSSMESLEERTYM